jgi:5'-3' exonuclease
MLTDTASLYFRAFYGVPETVRAPDGSPVNAVRGFLDMLARLAADRSPGRLVCCLDADWRPAFRTAAIPSYKAHRVAGPDGAEDVPSALAAQVPVLLDVLDALGITTVGAPGYEADDVIGTLAAREPGPTDVVTGDRDLFAVVDDARGVRVLYVARGVANREVVDGRAVRQRYGVAPEQYAALAILRGDPSDGLPGVPGVGEKTAAALVERFGSLHGLIDAVEQGSDGSGRRVRLVESLDYLRAAAAVVPVRTDVDLPDDLPTQVPAQVADPQRLVALSERFGLDSSLNRLATALRIAQTSS